MTLRINSHILTYDNIHNFHEPTCTTSRHDNHQSYHLCWLHFYWTPSQTSLLYAVSALWLSPLLHAYFSILFTILQHLSKDMHVFRTNNHILNLQSLVRRVLIYYNQPALVFLTFLYVSPTHAWMSISQHTSNACFFRYLNPASRFLFLYILYSCSTRPYIYSRRVFSHTYQLLILLIFWLHVYLMACPLIKLIIRNFSQIKNDITSTSCIPSPFPCCLKITSQ